MVWTRFHLVTSPSEIFALKDRHSCKNLFIARFAQRWHPDLSLIPFVIALRALSSRIALQSSRYLAASSDSFTSVQLVQIREKCRV
jgi:hypothetical protein